MIIVTRPPVVEHCSMKFYFLLCCSLLACVSATVCAAAGTPATDPRYPNKPIRFIVPFPQGGLHASREQGSRLRDATARESCAAAGTGTAALNVPGYPTKPIRFIVPFPPGGASDILARLTGQKVGDALGQQLVIDNRPGAGGNIAPELAAKAAADGHTLYEFNLSNTLSVSLYKKLAYDPIRDFAAVTELASVPFVLSVNPSVPATSVRELIELLKARPGRFNYASSGNGGPSHLAMELFKSATGVDVVHVPYKGGAPAQIDVIAGQVPMMFFTMPIVLPQLKAGKLRGLGVASTRRSALVPELPTVAEAGVPGFEASTWFGVSVPAGTPNSVIGKLHAEFTAALKLADVREQLIAQGFDIVGSSPAQFSGRIRTEMAKWAQVIKQSGLRMD